MATKPDWFKINPAQFLQDSVVDGLTMEELGCAFKLLCRQWIDGFIPDDINKLARMCRTDAKRMGDLWVAVSEVFPVREFDTLKNRFMDEERSKVIAQMEERSTVGKESAQKRWAPRLPMPDPMQDTDKNKKQNYTERKSKRETIPAEFVPFLEDIFNRWPRTSRDATGNRKVTVIRPIDMWEKIQKNRGTDTPKTCVNAAMAYLDGSPSTYVIGLDNFFGRDKKYTKYVVEE